MKKTTNLKAIYLTVITCITTLCVLIGCCYHIFGWFDSDTAENSKLQTNEQNITESFKKLSITCDNADVSLVQGDDYTVSYSCQQNSTPEIYVENDTLYINQTGGEHFYFSFFQINSAQNKITITIPKNTQLTSLSADCDINDLHIEKQLISQMDIYCSTGDIMIADTSCSNAAITSDVGDCIINNSIFETLAMTLDTGDTEIDQCIFKSFTVTADTGDVEISSQADLGAYNLDLSADIGDIEINDTECGTHFIQTGTNDRSIHVTTDTGDIEISE
ncbi:MAG: DUF4097 domain-containing protein [Clostridiaceae bacterium]|nr:DUF4097 domain-containing protein [Clostridiaceae bacterium]